MKEWYKDFIGVYENVFSKEYCTDLIKFFESVPDIRDRTTESFDKTAVDDHFVYAKDIPEEFIKYGTDILQNKVLKAYCNKYNIIPNRQDLFVHDWKVQRTNPTEGFHIWHSEWRTHILNPPADVNFSDIGRTLVWTLYLNDIEEGGETEFLYQSFRLKPKMGSVCIFPAYFTHAHRGNPPLKETKYIVTGWINSPIIYVK